MKIIFDSNEEQARFLNNACPGYAGLTGQCEHEPVFSFKGTCEECWLLAGVEMEVKKDGN